AAQVHGVVRAAVGAPVAAGEALHLVAVPAQELAPGAARRVRVVFLVVVAVEEALREADAGGDEPDLAHLVLGDLALALVVEDYEVEPQRGRAEGGGALRLDDGAREVAAADLRAAAVIHDGRSVARRAGEPEVVLDVGGLARAAEDADLRELALHRAGGAPRAHE